MANLSIVNSTSELAGRSKKVKKTYSRHRKVHGPGKTNKEILEKDHEEGMGDEDKENEDDEMEGSGADDNEEEVEKSSGILSGGDQRDNDRERNRSSPELGKHRDEEQAMEETDTVAAADKSEDEVEEEQGEALMIDGETLFTSDAATAEAATAANGTCVATSQATNISVDQQLSPSLPQLKRKRGRPSGSSKKSTHFSKVCPPSPILNSRFKIRTKRSTNSEGKENLDHRSRRHTAVSR
jgi:hypothetical protein